MGIYNIMFYGGLILAIIFLIATVVIFFVMKIPKSFGVVTGNTQRKAIEEIRSGGLGASSRKKNRVLGGTGNIQARDIDMSDAIKKSGILDKNKREDIKRSSDASNELAKKAAEDAARAAAKAAAGAKEKARRDLDNESTEVLTYNDMVSKGDSEDTTTILENEQATDVLTAGGDDYEADDYTADGYDEGDDATDVLTSGDVPNASKRDSKIDTSYDEEETDVLRRTSEADLYDDDLDEEIDKTDVLMADVSGLDTNAIYGTYNPEMTAVLRSDMAPGEDSVKSGPKKDLPGITVIYSETIVHTEESL